MGSPVAFVELSHHGNKVRKKKLIENNKNLNGKLSVWFCMILRDISFLYSLFFCETEKVLIRLV